MCDEVNANEGSNTVSPDLNRGVSVLKDNNTMVTFEETLAENILLKRELRSKLDQIVHLRSQLLSTYGNSHNSANSTFCIIEEEDPMVDVSRLIGECGRGDIPSTNSSENFPNRSMSENMLEWVEQNRSEVIQKVSKGSIIAKDLSIGIVGGYGSAWMIKKFGSIAITAIGGGFLLLQIANQRGYVIVNWNEIYNSIIDSDVSEDCSDDSSYTTNGETVESDWFSTKFHRFKKWSKDNTNLLIGFIGGFIYNTYA